MSVTLSEVTPFPGVGLGRVSKKGRRPGPQRQRFELDAFLHGAHELYPFENTITAWVLGDLRAA